MALKKSVKSTKRAAVQPAAKPVKGKAPSSPRVGELVAGNDIQFLPVDKLLLDPENPRLPESLQGESQLKMLRYIAKSEAVEDLMAAIGRNGFFPGEPLVVYRHPGEKGYRVIEGNRRLASVRLLNEPTLYKSRAILDIANETDEKNKPKELPVIVVGKRGDALPYLGSRHIVGVKSWEPLPKARYMLQLFNSTDKKRKPGERYRDVARQIGSGRRSDYVRKNLNALAVFNEIKSKEFYGDEDVEETSFSFGVLYTALDWKSIAAHVGIVKYDAETDKALEEYHPIVNQKVLDKSGVEDIYDWCFSRDEEGVTVLGESRNLSRLASVLRSPAATKVLRDTRNLDFAYERSGGVSEEAIDALVRAFGDLRYVNSVLAHTKRDATFLDYAEKVYLQAKQMAKNCGVKE